MAPTDCQRSLEEWWEGQIEKGHWWQAGTIVGEGYLAIGGPPRRKGSSGMQMGIFEKERWGWKYWSLQGMACCTRIFSEAQNGLFRYNSMCCQWWGNGRTDHWLCCTYWHVATCWRDGPRGGRFIAPTITITSLHPALVNLECTLAACAMWPSTLVGS